MPTVTVSSVKPLPKALFFPFCCLVLVVLGIFSSFWDPVSHTLFLEPAPPNISSHVSYFRDTVPATLLRLSPNPTAVSSMEDLPVKCSAAVIGDPEPPASWSVELAGCSIHRISSISIISPFLPRGSSWDVPWNVSVEDIVFHVGKPSFYGLPAAMDNMSFDKVRVTGLLDSSGEFDVVAAMFKTLRLAASFVKLARAEQVELVLRNQRHRAVSAALASLFDQPCASYSRPGEKVLVFDSSVMPELPPVSSLGFKIYVYEGLPAEFTTYTPEDRKMYLDPESGRSQYCTDYIVHHNVLSCPLRTYNPEEADLFFVPYYAMASYRAFVSENRITRWLAVNSAYFSRYGGIDHVFALPATHSYFKMRFTGSRVLKRPWISMGFEITKPLYSSPNISKNIVTPYPSFLRPFGRDDDDAILASKDILLSFAGSYTVFRHVRIAMRDAMIAKCKPGECWLFSIDHVSVGNGSVPLNTSEIVSYYERSKFCFAPAGWSTVAKRTVDVMHALCIPIIVSDKATMPYESLLPWRSFSLRFSADYVRNHAEELVEILRSIPEEKVKSMQNALVKARRRLQFHYPDAQEGDSFHMVLLELQRRVHFLRFSKRVQRWRALDGHSKAMRT